MHAGCTSLPFWHLPFDADVQGASIPFCPTSWLALKTWIFPWVFWQHPTVPLFLSYNKYWYFKAEEISNTNTVLHSDACWNKCTLQPAVQQNLGEIIYSKKKDIIIQIEFFFCLLSLQLACAASKPGAVTQSYIWCILWKNAFGAQGQWRILIIPCRPWKLSEPSLLHPFFWLSHSGQVCLTIGIEEHLEVKSGQIISWNAKPTKMRGLHACCLFAIYKL